MGNQSSNALPNSGIFIDIFNVLTQGNKGKTISGAEGTYLWAEDTLQIIFHSHHKHICVSGFCFPMSQSLEHPDQKIVSGWKNALDWVSGSSGF